MPTFGRSWSPTRSRRSERQLRARCRPDVTRCLLLSLFDRRKPAASDGTTRTSPSNRSVSRFDQLHIVLGVDSARSRCNYSVDRSRPETPLGWIVSFKWVVLPCALLHPSDQQHDRVGPLAVVELFEEAPRCSKRLA